MKVRFIDSSSRPYLIIRTIIWLTGHFDVVAVISRLGHRDATTTLQIYAHALRRRDVDAANAAQSLLDRANTPSHDPALR
ncbi:MAG: hypothetical protein JW811_07855 [Clostridiales bacterium]|nr:hypothetical protein [Clostridiales bacterium]